MAINISLAAATQLLAAREPRVALMFQALMLGFTALVFTLAIVSRTLMGSSQIIIDPQRALNWWRSKILGRGVQIRRQSFSTQGGRVDDPAQMPKLEQRDKPIPLRVLLGQLMRPRGLDPAAGNLYDIFYESLNCAWDDVWTTVRAASFSLILITSALLIMDGGLAWAIQEVEDSAPSIARGLGAMELCVTVIILANGLGLMLLGAACTFMRRGQQGVVLVLAGYALTVCPILIYTQQCGVLLPILAGGAGVAATAVALACDVPPKT